MKYYQLNDSEGESMGILMTNIPLDKVAEAWNAFYLESEDCGVDTFAEYLREQFPDPQYEADRFYIDEEINP